MNLSDYDMYDVADEAVSDRAFVCPGASVGISRAVHLARLHAGWSVCDQCECRKQTEGLSQQVVDDIQRVQEFRRDGLERTEFGVRGPWLNVLDRSLAERLAEVFCVCLQRVEHDRLPSAQSAGVVSADSATVSEVVPVREALHAIVIGYDGRSFSEDLYAGVTAAVSRLGFPVYDVGRTTAAALQEAMRRTAGVLGSVLVTGAGYGPAWAGLDVFDAAGESVAVVWKDFGIRLYQSSESTRTGSRLQLDTAGLSDTGRRISRSSGGICGLDAENLYRRWLSTWFTGTAGRGLVVVSNDPLVTERVEWLQRQGLAELVLRGAQAVDSTTGVLRLLISEDDRYFVLQDAEGRSYPADLLAQRLNRLLGTGFGQLTVHSDVVTGRVWLTDSVLPTAGAGTGAAVERIEDGLAFAGLLLRLNPGGRLLV